MFVIHSSGTVMLTTNLKDPGRSGCPILRHSPGAFVKVIVKTSRKMKQDYLYTGCPRRNVPDFGRVFLMLKYTDITQNTYVQS